MFDDDDDDVDNDDGEELRLNLILECFLLLLLNYCGFC